MSVLTKSLAASRAVVSASYDRALKMKSSGMLSTLTPAAGMGGLGSWQRDGKYRERYELFRGWFYPAINGIAQEAAG